MDAIHVGYNPRYAINLRQSYRRDHVYYNVNCYYMWLNEYQVRSTRRALHHIQILANLVLSLKYKIEN